MKIAIAIFIVMLIVSACSRASEADLDAIAKAALLVDVRTAGEYSGGHLDGAILIPYDEIAGKIAQHAKNKDERIVLYCRSGHRAGVAKSTLEKMGYTAVVNAGAYTKLKAGLAKRAKAQPSAKAE